MLRPTVIAFAAALGGCQQAAAPPAAEAANIVHAVEHAQAQVDTRRPASGKAGPPVGAAR